MAMKASLIRDVASRPDARQFAFFVASGGMATIVQYSVLIGLIEGAHRAPTLSAILAYLCGALTSYLLNFHFTFRHSGTDFRKGLAKFFLVNVIGLGLNTAIFVGLRDLGAFYLVAQAAATGLVLVWNYLGARLFVFRG
jgi:putative flippase GtrA